MFRSVHRAAIGILLAAVLFVAWGCTAPPPRVIENDGAVVREAEPVATPPSVAAGDDVDDAIMRAARTPISFRALDRNTTDSRSEDRTVPSLADLVAGIEPAKLSAAPESAPPAPAGEAISPETNSAMWSVSKMGLILTRKIVLPGTSLRQPLDEGQRMPGPDRPSGTDRTPGPAPSPAPNRFER
jgi:hypothetical protein